MPQESPRPSDAPRCARSSSARTGLTLLELLLVLGLLVVLAALAGPTLRGSLENRKLNVAADALRSVWAKARVEAMKSGAIQGFRFEIGGEHYRQEPYFGPDEMLNDSGLEASDATRSDFVVGQEDIEQRLVEGVTFVAGQQATEQRGAEAAAAISAEQPESRGRDEDDLDVQSRSWSPPILFYPDGTCSSAVVVLRNRNGRQLAVTLRALTGTSRVGEVFVEESDLE